MLSALVIIALFIISTWGFAIKNYHLLRESNYKYLSEIATNHSVVCRNIFEKDEKFLNAVAEQISAGGDSFGADSYSYLRKLQQVSDFNEMGLVDKDGIGRLSDGTDVDISKTPYFKQALKGETVVLGPTTISTDASDALVVAVPVTKDGRKTGVLFGFHNKGHLDSLLDFNIESWTGHTDVIKPDGTFVYKSAQEYAIANNKNLFSALQNVALKDGGSLDQIRASLSREESGHFAFMSNGEEMIAFYSPVGIGNWFVVEVVSTDLVSNDLLEFEKLVIILALQYSILVVLLATVLIDTNRKNRVHSSGIEDELLVMNSAISLAFKSSTKVIFSYDFNNHTARYVFGNIKLWGLPLFVENYPEILFEQDITLDQDRQNLFDAFERAETSTGPVTCVVKHVFDDSSVGWNRVTLTSVRDIEDDVIFSVGFLEDITTLVTAEKRATQEKYVRRALLSGTAKAMRINLLNDTVTFLDDEGNAESTELRYSEYVEENARIVDPKIREEFIDMFSPVSIVALSTSGTNTISYDFLYCSAAGPASISLKNGDASQKWMRFTVHVMVEESTEDLHAFAYLYDITEEKNRELQLVEKAEIDELTQVYNRSTVEVLTNSFLAEGDGPAEDTPSCQSPSCVFYIIDIDDFKEINDTFGHPAGDKVLAYAGLALKALFREKDIVARLGGDEFVVILKNTSDRELARQKAQAILDIFSQPDPSLNLPSTLSCSIGYAIAPEHGVSFSDLYHASDIALYSTKKSKGGYVYYGDIEDRIEA